VTKIFIQNLALVFVFIKQCSSFFNILKYGGNFLLQTSYIHFSRVEHRYQEDLLVHNYFSTIFLNCWAFQRPFLCSTLQNGAQFFTLCQIFWWNIVTSHMGTISFSDFHRQ
jgi:hypothetical protein